MSDIRLKNISIDWNLCQGTIAASILAQLAKSLDLWDVRSEL